MTRARQILWNVSPEDFNRLPVGLLELTLRNMMSLLCSQKLLQDGNVGDVNETLTRVARHGGNLSTIARSTVHYWSNLMHTSVLRHACCSDLRTFFKAPFGVRMVKLGTTGSKDIGVCCRLYHTPTEGVLMSQRQSSCWL